MTSVQKALPKNGASRFRDGHATHWQVVPGSNERGLVKKEMFCSRADANARAGEIRSQINRGVYVRDDKTTVAEWAEKWLAAKVVGGVRPRSREIYGHSARQVASPMLGSLPMTAVRPEDVRGWVASLRKRTDEPFAPGTARNIVGALRSMFALWTADGRPLPNGNPVARGLAPRPPERRYDPLTPAQVQAWRDALPEEIRPMFDVEAYTGARVSEVLGLHEEDVTWVGRDVAAPLADQLRRLADEPPERYVERKVAVRFQRQLKWEQGQPVSAPMKNRRANRVVPLSQPLVRVLADHLDENPPSARGWLFTNSDALVVIGRNDMGVLHVDHQPYTGSRYGKRLIKAAKAVGVTLPTGQCTHALRHYCVSVLRDARRHSDQEIADWIGDTVQTVQGTYGRPMPGHMDRMAATLTELNARPRLRAVGD